MNIFGEIKRIDKKSKRELPEFFENEFDRISEIFEKMIMEEGQEVMDIFWSNKEKIRNQNLSKDDFSREEYTELLLNGMTYEQRLLFVELMRSHRRLALKSSKEQSESL